MPTRLVLIRHGQTSHNVAGRVAGWTDSPLSEVGLAQAERMSAHVVARYELDGLYASPLRRARHTAQAIGRRAGLVPVLLDDLKELNFGDLENLTEAEIASRYPDVWAASRVLEDHTFAWPGGECRGSFYGRVRQAFDEIIAGHPSQTVAVVSHGGVLGSFVADVVEGQPHLWQKYLLKNCAIAEVHADGGRARLVCFNDHSFLPDYGPDPLLASLALTSDGDDPTTTGDLHSHAQA